MLYKKGKMSPTLEFLHIDHNVPRNDAGSDNPDNLCLLCPPCNIRKAHILTLDELRKENRRHKDIIDESKMVK